MLEITVEEERRKWEEVREMREVRGMRERRERRGEEMEG